jgi:DNA mismatch endonuclease (patch repair protein)
MADVLTKNQRHRCMSAIRNKDTKPEKVVRRLVHSLGYRYRLQGSDLPGRPDLIFSGKRKVIFVHGCFWHRHSCNKGHSMPSTRIEFWRKKLEDNKERDKTNRLKLRKLGWKSLVIWECETKPSKKDKLKKRIREFLDS